MPGMPTRLSQKSNLVLCAAILLGFVFLIPVIFSGVPEARKDFYDNIWAPANLLTHGQNPYLPASIKTGLPTLWLPMALGVLFPLGMLGPETATRAWFLFNVFETALIVLVAQGERRTPITTAAAALALYFFPATIHDFVLGQFTLTAILALLVAARCAQRGRDWWAAFLLALAFAKPQLAFLAAIGLLYYYWSRWGVQRSLKFGLKCVLAAVVLSLPMLASPSAWLPAWWENIRNNPSWLHPSLFSVLSGSLGIYGLGLWMIMAIGSGLASLAAWKSLQREDAMAWTLALTTIIAPYIWSWDFVLLMPLWISTFTGAAWRGKLLLILVYAGAWTGMAILQLRTEASNQAFWWVPLWFTLALAVLSTRGLRGGRSETGMISGPPASA